MNKKNYFLLLSSFIIFGFLISSNVFASAVINSVKINDSKNVEIKAGLEVKVTLNVSLTEASVWKSTAYKIGNGKWNCVDTPNYKANANISETFPIFIYGAEGKADIDFEIYSNDDCTDAIALGTASISSAILNIISLGTGDVWISILSVIIILVVISVIIYFLFNNYSSKK